MRGLIIVSRITQHYNPAACHRKATRRRGEPLQSDAYAVPNAIVQAWFAGVFGLVLALVLPGSRGDSSDRPTHATIRKRHTTSPLDGDTHIGYAVAVTIDGREYNLLVDTGSSTLAVAASIDLGCTAYYPNECDGPDISEVYVFNNWTGKVCTADIRVVGRSAGPVRFGGIKTQHRFHPLQSCNSQEVGAEHLPTTFEQQGIMGMAYQKLLDTDESQKNAGWCPSSTPS